MENNIDRNLWIQKWALKQMFEKATCNGFSKQLDRCWFSSIDRKCWECAVKAYEEAHEKD